MNFAGKEKIQSFKFKIFKGSILLAFVKKEGKKADT